MLTFFENRLTQINEPNELTWKRCMSLCSDGKKFSLVNKTWKKDTLKIFSYIESKRFSHVDNNYSHVIRDNRFDIFNYIWKQDAHLWEYYFKASCKYNKLEIIHCIESRIKEKIDWNRYLTICSKFGNSHVFHHCESKCEDTIDWKIHLSNASKTTNFNMFKYIIARHKKSESNEKLDWKLYMTKIVRKRRRTRLDKHGIMNVFLMFIYCEHKSKSSHYNYNRYMRNALHNGLIHIVQYCEMQLNRSEIDVDWTRCASHALSGGHMNEIKYVESKTRN